VINGRITAVSVDPNTLEELAKCLQQSPSVVAFTGAGISTESGIPDFRSPGGVWSKYRTVYFDEFMASESARHEYWRQKCEAHGDFAQAAANAGHLVLARWEQAGRLRGVITQNIDGLHQTAGSRNVLQLHGTAREVMCMDCGARYDVAPMVEQFRQTDRVPPCEHCPDGRLKHATISFGQSLPREVLEEAVRWCTEADLILAIGSSLVVTPAADLPQITKQSGGRLAIINRDATPLDSLADWVLNAPIGETLSGIDECLG